MTAIEARFKRCKECERNANVGFAGPPECDLKLVPDERGHCPSFTTEVADQVFTPTVQVDTDALRSLLEMLHPIAERARTGKVVPLAVGVGSGNVAFRVSDGETNIVASLKASTIQEMQQVSFEEVMAAIPDDASPTVIALDGQDLKVHGRTIAKFEGSCSAMERDWPSGPSAKTQAVAVPTLEGNTAFLMRALHDDGHQVLKNVYVELPAFTCVASDGKRLHIRRPLPVVAQPTASVLLSRYQFQWFWTTSLTDKTMAHLSGQFWRVAGGMQGWTVTATFEAPTGEYPTWRKLVEVKYPAGQVKSVPVADVRAWTQGEGTHRVQGVVPIQKRFLSDAIAAWPDEAVEMLWSHGTAPVILVGSDRSAVIIWDTEEAPAAVKPTKKRPAPAPAEAPAQVSGEHLVAKFAAGQRLMTSKGEYEVVKARMWYLLRTQDGQTHWFAEDGLEEVTQEVNSAAA